MKPKVLVTRPQPGADQTASRLKAHGFDPIVLPFTEMVPTNSDNIDRMPEDVSLVLATSANALRFASADLIEQIKHLPFYGVGDATCAAASGVGFSDIHSADGNAQDLISLLAETGSTTSTYVYLCGETRTTDIEASLAKSGQKFQIVETYKTKKVSQLTYNFQTLVEQVMPAAVLLYSSISAAIYQQMSSTHVTGEVSEKPMVFCISQRAKSELSLADQAVAIVASVPRDDAMIKAVRDYFHQD